MAWHRAPIGRHDSAKLFAAIFSDAQGRVPSFDEMRNKVEHENYGVEQFKVFLKKTGAGGLMISRGGVIAGQERLAPIPSRSLRRRRLRRRKRQKNRFCVEA